MAPGQYACAIANGGIYNLELMYTDGDIENFNTQGSRKFAGVGVSVMV